MSENQVVSDQELDEQIQDILRSLEQFCSTPQPVTPPEQFVNSHSNSASPYTTSNTFNYPVEPGSFGIQNNLINNVTPMVSSTVHVVPQQIPYDQLFNLNRQLMIQTETLLGIVRFYARRLNNRNRSRNKRRRRRRNQDNQ